ncbi:hypothetical protein D3C75_1004710 [compost metagenome]
MHVIVGVTITLCLTQTHAINDRCVVQRIGDNRIFRAKQCFKQTAVGIKTRRIKNGIFHSEEAGQFAFQLFVAVLCSTNETHRGHPKAMRIHALFSSIDKLWVVSEAEIVIGAEVDDVTTVSNGNICLLSRSNNTFFFKQPFRSCGFKLGC